MPDLNTAYTTYGCNEYDVVLLNLTTDNQATATSDAQSEGKEYPVLYGGADGGFNHYCPSGVPSAILIAPNRDVINDDIYPTTANINSAYNATGNISQHSCTATLTADFSANNVEIAPGESVTFTDNSNAGSDPITSWNWTFTGGNPSSFNGQNPPAITYSAEGQYEVSLTVGDGTDTDTETKTAYIKVSYYCNASSNSDAYEYIENVNFGTIDNNSSRSGYSDFTAQSTALTIGHATNLTVTINSTYNTDQVLAWIDWNADGDFEDTNEEVFVSSTGIGPFSTSVTPPTGANIGTTRMRIRLHDTGSGPNDQPCGSSSYGEVEDYSVEVSPMSNINSFNLESFSIYPNPNDGIFSIKTTSDASNIKITDISGKVVYEDSINQSFGLIDLSNNKAGIYFIEVSTENGRCTKKIIIN